MRYINKRKILLLSIFILMIISAPSLYSEENNTMRFKRLSIEDGLSQSTVNCIIQDKQGFMWFATQEGLNRFDGYTFNHYKVDREAKEKDDESKKSLSDNYLWALAQDEAGTLWIGTNKGGLNRFDPKKEEFKYFNHNPNEPTSISSDEVKCICQDPKSPNTLWIGTHNGLNKLNKNTGTFTRFLNAPNNKDSQSSNSVSAMCIVNNTLWIGTEDGNLRRSELGTEKTEFKSYTLSSADTQSPSSNYPLSIYYDSNDTLWVGTQVGLFKYEPDTDQFTYIRFKPISSPTEVSCLLDDTKDNLWVGTRGDGLFNLNKNNNKATHYENDTGNYRSLSKDSLNTLFKDKTGNLWIGTRAGGINITSKSLNAFAMYEKISRNTNSLSDSDIRSIYQDKDGIIWVGTFRGGLNRYDRKKNQFTHFEHDPSNAESLSQNWVSEIFRDHAGIMWIGTWGGGLNQMVEGSSNDKGGKFIHYSEDSTDPTKKISHNKVKTIFEDSQNNLWLGTYGGGLTRINEKRTQIVTFSKDDNIQNIFKDNRIMIVTKAPRKDEYWIGTRQGEIIKFRPIARSDADKFEKLYEDDDRPEEIKESFIEYLHEDSSENLWVGSSRGLLKIDLKTKQCVAYNVSDGLPSDVIYSIIEDKQGNFWMSSNGGLTVFDPKYKTPEFLNFNIDDGLQGNEFNFGAYFKNPDTGEMFFGGINGLNAFFPEIILNGTPFSNSKDPQNTKKTNQDEKPEIVISRLFINNEPQSIHKYVPKGNVLDLGPDENNFSFEFAVTDYSNPKKNRFKYKLDKINKDWVTTSSESRRATYTNVPPGTYFLTYSGCNKDGVWAKEQKIQLTVSPHWYLSAWMILIYILIVIGVIRLVEVNRKRKTIVSQQKKINTKLEELNKLKDEFLATTSHELRTPLQGIVGLAEALLENKEFDSKTSRHLEMIASSGQRLTTLVNDLIDFSLLKNNNLTLDLTPVGVHGAVETVIQLIRPLVNTSKIQIFNKISPSIPFVMADKNRLMQILHNLIGNAVKFTEEGTITVNAQQKNDMIQIKVIDTGIGIPEDKLESIFNSFEQVEKAENRSHEGMGLGLSITKQLIELHGGSIKAESKVDKGSTFIFSLPASKSGPQQSPPVFRQTQASAKAKVEKFPAPQENQSENTPAILVVDDEPTIREVIGEYLCPIGYLTINAASGKEALKLIEERPNLSLVLLDVMMPKMSGYDVCRKIRKKYSASELPVVFLTAKSQENDLLTAFEAGANDFLVKPISKLELLSRVKTHLSLRQSQYMLALSEKMAALGVLVSGIAHEINNPVAYMNTATYNLRKELKKFRTYLTDLAGGDLEKEISDAFDEKFKSFFTRLGSIEDGAKRASKIAGDLRIFTKTEDEKKPGLVLEGLKATVHLVHTKYKDTIEFATDYNELPPIHSNISELNQVFLNILTNGCHAIEEKYDGKMKKGTMTIVTEAKKNRAFIHFTNDGAPLPNHIKKNIFDPFFTTKPLGQGTGVGLWLSYNIIKKHKGSIEVKNDLDKTTFTIDLPISNKTNAQENKKSGGN